jgi:hypothetical protein
VSVYDRTYVSLRSRCGGQRFAFNWGLALVKANLEQRWAEKSYGIPAAELMPSLSWSAYDLRKLWNRVKDTTAPWWAENSKEAYSSGLANLTTALSNWNASRSVPAWPEGSVSPVQGQTTRHVVSVHHRRVRPVRC